MDIDISGETFTIAEDAAAKRFTVSHAGKVIGLANGVDVPLSSLRILDSRKADGVRARSGTRR